MKRLLLFASCSCSCSCSSLLAPFAATAATTIDATDKFAYGANIGWINLAGNGPDGVVVGDFFLSGFAYGANVGWINFGNGAPANDTAYSNSTSSDYGVNQDGAGHLSGFAYGANIGWINFDWAAPNDPDRPRFSLSNGNFSGFAYGANVGWINLGAGFLATDTLFCADGDGDGISDAWEIDNFGDKTTANAISDQDGDGLSDQDEYFGGSDPKDAASFLKIVAQSASPATLPVRDVTLEFTSSPGRLYQIAVSDDLISFTDSGLGTFAPDPGATTTKGITVSGSTKFYRLVAVKPLQ